MSDITEPTDANRRKSDALVPVIKDLIKAIKSQESTSKALHDDSAKLAILTADRLKQFNSMQQSQRRRSVAGGITIFIMVATMLVIAVYNRVTLNKLNDCLNKSTDPETCYVEQRKDQGKVILQIIDTNNNGVADNQEILEELKKRNG